MGRSGPKYGARMKRREFVRQASGGLMVSAFAWQARATTSPFRLSVITDDLSQDFDRACNIAANDFGLKWVEVRELWKKNCMALDANEIAEARRIVERHGLQVTDIASPLFKVDWKGAPRSKFSPEGDKFSANYTFDQQGEILERAIALAKTFGSQRVRCFV